MKLGIVISTNDAETVWNAFRLANFSLKNGDNVGVFLVGKAVEYDKNRDVKFDAAAEAEKFADANGKIMACGTCMKLREKEGTKTCPISSLKDLHALINESEKIDSF